METNIFSSVTRFSLMCGIQLRLSDFHLLSSTRRQFDCINSKPLSARVRSKLGNSGGREELVQKGDTELHSFCPQNQCLQGGHYCPITASVPGDQGDTDHLTLPKSTSGARLRDTWAWTKETAQPPSHIAHPLTDRHYLSKDGKGFLSASSSRGIAGISRRSDWGKGMEGVLLSVRNPA